MSASKGRRRKASAAAVRDQKRREAAAFLVESNRLRRRFLFGFVAPTVLICLVALGSVIAYRAATRLPAPEAQVEQSVYRLARSVTSANRSDLEIRPARLHASVLAMGATPLDRVAGPGAVSLASAPNGHQSVLVESDARWCLAVALPAQPGGGLRNVPAAPGYLFGKWPSGGGGCDATSVPSSAEWGPSWTQLEPRP